MDLLILLLVVVVLVVIGAAALGVVVNILWWALIGLVIGALARVVVPGTQGVGLLATALFGIAGSLLGGIVANAADLGSILEFVVAVLVAALLIATFTAGRRREAA